jgi:hypothetical protein
MTSREELHSLVDSLPEKALEPAGQILNRFQNWPPVHNVPPEFELKRDGRPGMLQGFGGAGNYSPVTRSGSSSQTHWDGDTLVVQTRHYHLGNLLDVTQSIRLIENKHLVYKHEVSGPNGKTGEHEIRFDIEA